MSTQTQHAVGQCDHEPVETEYGDIELNSNGSATCYKCYEQIWPSWRTRTDQAPEGTHVREVLPGEITITREEFDIACINALQEYFNESTIDSHTLFDYLSKELFGTLPEGPHERTETEER